MADSNDKTPKESSEKTPETVTPIATSVFAPNEKPDKINVAEEIKNSFLDYSMSVIISRALPDARDGLKPSQRRILFAMHELGIFPNRKTLKCARIVGEAMGKYHPHGDQAIYPTLVHMAQPWAMRELLIDGQGNFGSVEGDPPAAMRYTEARLAHLGAILMMDMDKDTVDFVPNYDGEHMEPVVLPSAFPNLLVNGGTGIAVGMATNIAPHNLGEIVDAVCAQIDKPSITTLELMKYVKGPDFPTGCTVCGLEGIREYFETGRGSMKIRGKATIEEMKGGREQIIITEIPYNVNRATMVERIAELVNEKTLTDISGVRDESDENTRVVIDLKRDAVAKVVMNNLYKFTQFESSFSVNMLAIDHGRPKTLGLKALIQCYIEHRREVIIRRTKYELRKAEERAETLEGFLIALANLDDFIRIIRSSNNREEAKVKLMAYEFTRPVVEQLGILIRSEARLVNGFYAFSEAQANAILDLRLYQLTGMERDKVKAEYNLLIVKIKDLMDILAREERVFEIVKAELREIKTKYASPRRTDLVPDEGEIAIEDLITNEGVIITLSHNGLIKRTTASSYRAQKRGGRGVIGMATRESSVVEGEGGDFIEHLFTASTHDYLFFFTNTGRTYMERVYEIPDMPRTSVGRNIANILELKADEKIASMIRVVANIGPNNEDQTWTQENYLFFATKMGTVKKTALAEYSHTNKSGLIAINIDPGDILIGVKLSTGHDEIVLITAEGQSIRFSEEDVRPMGRATHGVKGITLDENDSVVALAEVAPDAMLLVAGENGIGKRTRFEEYRLQSRGGKGVITMKKTEKTGAVIGALTVRESDELMMITSGGQMVRIGVKDIRETGRDAQGVILIRTDEGDKLQAIAPIINEDNDEKEEQAAPEQTPPASSSEQVPPAASSEQTPPAAG